MYYTEFEWGSLHKDRKSKRGSLEVICGSMFSGKTEELMRRLKRARIAKQKVELFKPSIDTRYAVDDVVSHDHNSCPCRAAENSMNIFLLGSDADVVGIDEVQFLDLGITDVCKALANDGVRVIVSGLDMDFKGKPFGPVPYLCAVADSVTKVHAICLECGAPALYSHRISDSEDLVLLGEKEDYVPLCRHCYELKNTMFLTSH